ncbi:hypothetical protein TpMuguga_01g00038 [Theileria parva strain Muguga]|uniref:Uncharacterized protein n=1 Tax=Theileria parva TaxID=5875 RepID=Q4N9S6_THEPA|nr:uncharacterized protein TpMuguga_01g00038 [Theileria parva strain Muguga]EAN33282.1 hypothetical protein TpMuguga_01g00038 [Theileria parva strain Muguga]|eukprot:XP_765565.1 hypothetical protein [Theileria parva strain Muguga]
MIKPNKNSNSGESKFGLSVLDTLLNRDIYDVSINETTSEIRGFYSDSDNNSHLVSSSSSHILSENGIPNSTLESPLFTETKTPTNRSEQLPILLARNYYTAPPCLLRFVNSTSTIRSYKENKRDSDGTVLDNEYDPIIDCNVDTNDEMDDYDLNENDVETFSIGTMTNRTSLMSDQQFPDSDELAYMNMDPLELNLVLQNASSKRDPHFDKGCSPFVIEKSTDSNTNSKVTVDIGTSPLIMDETELFDKWVSTDKLDEDTEVKVEDIEIKLEPTTMDSYPPELESNDLNTTDVDVEPSEFPINDDAPDSKEYSTLESGDFSIKNQELPQENQIPVYCRSLLYRIRVPLSKRLKNINEDALNNSLSSPLNSPTKVNLSCDRLFSSKTKSPNSIDYSYSLLSVRDLEPNRSDSSNLLPNTNYDFSKNKGTKSNKIKRNLTSSLGSQGRNKIRKRSRPLKR